jgi:tRNA 2-selenouridine synthase
VHSIITLQDALLLDNPIFIDMRSPAEFANGHIPGALNIPLFDNDERHQVGLIYKTTGPDQARQRGLAIVSTKLPALVSAIRSHYDTGRRVVIYCWRGGMRSKSVVSVLALMGIEAFQLMGGYKAYRRYVLDRLADFPLAPRIVVLCGSTGVGKTTLLSLLAQQGAAVIDLERLANHRGSAFGHIALGRPATAQNFDAALLGELERLNTSPYILVECESKRVGNVYLPDVLYRAMQQGPKILVHTSVETRIARLIDEYVTIYRTDRDAIVASIKSLQNRLGSKKIANLLAAFADDRLADVVRTLLVDYYDPLYGYETADGAGFDCVVDATDLQAASQEIMAYLNK